MPATKEKKALNLITPVSHNTGNAADAMGGAYIDSAVIVNANGCRNMEDGDVIIAANYSDPNSFALRHLTDDGYIYIIISEYSLIAWSKPDNYIKG